MSEDKKYTEKDLKLAATFAWIERLKRDTVKEHNDPRDFETWYNEEVLAKL